MKKTVALWLVLGLAATFAFPSQVKAQTPENQGQLPVPAGVFNWPPVNAEADKGPLETAIIDLQHVSPEVMAYWIDPHHNPEPAEFRRLSELQKNGALGRRRALVGAASTAPAKQERATDARVTITPATDRNALIVEATGDNINYLRQIVKLLDHKIPRVDIEIEAVEAAAEDIELILPGVMGHESNARVMAGISISDRRHNLPRTVDSLVRENRARRYFHVRTRQIHNLPCATIIDGQLDNPHFNRIGFISVPTIESNGAIRISLSIEKEKIGNSVISAGQPNPTPTGDASFETVCKLGDTLVISDIDKERKGPYLFFLVTSSRVD